MVQSKTCNANSVFKDLYFRYIFSTIAKIPHIRNFIHKTSQQFYENIFSSYCFKNGSCVEMVKLFFLVI